MSSYLLKTVNFKYSVFNFEAMHKKNYLCVRLEMVVVAQLVRALDCGSRGRRFEPGLPPNITFKFV